MTRGSRKKTRRKGKSPQRRKQTDGQPGGEKSFATRAKNRRKNGERSGGSEKGEKKKTESRSGGGGKVNWGKKGGTASARWDTKQE